MPGLRFMLIGGLVLAGVAGAAALAQSGPPSQAQPAPVRSQCFYVGDLNGFDAPDDHTLYIRVGVNDIYRLDLMGSCTDLPFKQRFGLESAGGDPWICNPLQATVVIRDPGAPNRCPVKAIHKLTPDEVKAIPKGYRP